MSAPAFNIRVINLARSPQRWGRISASLQALGLSFERLEAVDGAALSDAQVEACYDAQANRQRYFMPLRRTEVACFLSHRKAWASVQAAAPLVVLEDDVEFVAPPQAVLSVLAAYLQQAGPCMVKLYSKRAVRGQVLATWPGGYQLIRPSLAPLGAQAQALNHAAAQRLLAVTERFWEPVDVALQRRWDTGVDMLVLAPNVVREVSAEVGGSTIQGRAAALAGPGFAARFQRELARPWFRLRRWGQALLK